MADLKLSDPNFQATTIFVEAVSEAGKAFFAEMYGVGACSVELLKSFGGDFIVFAERKGLTVQQ